MDFLEQDANTRDVPNETGVAQCNICRRKSWDKNEIGHTCYITQPDGRPCFGEMRATQEWPSVAEQEAYWQNKLNPGAISSECCPNCTQIDNERLP